MAVRHSEYVHVFTNDRYTVLIRVRRRPPPPFSVCHIFTHLLPLVASLSHSGLLTRSSTVQCTHYIPVVKSGRIRYLFPVPATEKPATVVVPGETVQQSWDYGVVLAVCLSVLGFFIFVIAFITCCFCRVHRKNKTKQRVIIPRPNVENPHYGDLPSEDGVHIQADEWEFDRKL